VAAKFRSWCHSSQAARVFHVPTITRRSGLSDCRRSCPPTQPGRFFAADSRQIGSVALVADGYHARVDGWTSLAVLLGAIGVWAGYPLADPIVGLLISVAIFVIVWQSARAVMVRMLDGVDAETLETIGNAARHVPRVEEVTDLRARWIGHRLHAEVSITVPGGLSVGDGHEVAKEVRHQLLHHLPHLGRVMVHVDP